MFKPSEKASSFVAEALDLDRPLAGFWQKPELGYEWIDWEVGPDEHFDGLPPDLGPWLIPKGREWIRYPILRRRRLLPVLVELGMKCTPERILTFANEWGSLGRGERVVPGRLGRGLSGASLGTWRSSAGMFSALWHLWEWVSREDRDQIAPFVRWERSPTRVIVSMIVRGGVPDRSLTRSLDPERGDVSLDAFGGAAPGECLQGRFRVLTEASNDPWNLLTKWPTSDVFEPMRYYVAHSVNEALRGGISRAVLPYVDYAVRYFPDSLLSAAYVLLQDHIAGGTAVERQCLAPFCPNGGRFIPKRRDQRYCDSLCRNRAYYHAKKARLSGE